MLEILEFNVVHELSIIIHNYSECACENQSQNPCLYQTLLRYPPNKQSVSEGKFGVFRLDV